jgi:hypothetical protein
LLEQFCLVLLIVFYENQCIGLFLWKSQCPYFPTVYTFMFYTSQLNFCPYYQFQAVIIEFWPLIADQRLIYVTYEVWNFKSIETVIFWNVTHCSLTAKYWHFRGTCSLHLLYKRRQPVPLKHWYLFIYHVTDVTLFKMENFRFIPSSLTRDTLIFPDYFSVK